MEYISVEEAVKRPGLRLVLGPRTPGPWGEGAKGVLGVKHIPYTAVEKPPEGERALLLEWTRQTSAPVAMYERERPRSGWAEILFLAERLAPEPALVPAHPLERMQMLGLCFEICGEHGLGWSRRLMIMPPDQRDQHDSMPWKYGLEDASAIARATARVSDILKLLADLLRAQQEKGRRYLIGSSLSAADIYWASFSIMVAPLPHALCPMAGALRETYEGSLSELRVDSALLAHRDFVLEEHLGLPMDF